MVNSAPPHTLAVIPARGGSKGIPRKNLQGVAGKPLLSWTIEAATSARTVGRVIVSTDAQEIGLVAQQSGAEVIWRPTTLSGDEASSESALLHTLDHLERTEGYRPERLIFLQCTSPLMLPDDIDGTVEVLQRMESDCALAVAPFHSFIWQWDQRGSAVGVNHSSQQRLLRQQMGDQFVETGAIYVMRTDGFRAAKHRFFGKIALYIMPSARWLELDEPIQVRIADVLLRDRVGVASEKDVQPVASLPISSMGCPPGRG